VIDRATRELIDRLLLESIPLTGIARTTQVSEQWLQTVERIFITLHWVVSILTVVRIGLNQSSQIGRLAEYVRFP
jgi:hypothetical protein